MIPIIRSVAVTGTFPGMSTIVKAVILELGRLNLTTGPGIHPSLLPSSAVLNGSPVSNPLDHIDGGGPGKSLQDDLAAIDSSHRFYLAMLCISLIVGIVYCCYAGYIYWYKSRVFLSYVLAIAVSLLINTFFKLLLLTIFFMGESTDVDGSNTLIAFIIFSDLMASSYWLILSIYLHESTESLFNSEPNMKLFHYGITGVATFFALVWTFILSGAQKNWVNLLLHNPSYIWIVEILRLLYICVQTLLTFNIGGMIIMKKSTIDTECVSLLRKSGLVFLGLIVLFWTELGFSVSNPPTINQLTYLYFLYLVEGLQCAIACPLLFLLEKWGHEISGPRANATRTVIASGHSMPPPKTQEILINNPYRRAISTIESVYGGQAQDRLDTETPDVVYSNVVPPERLGKTFDLYKRLGILLTADSTFDLSDENYYECREDDAKTVYNDCISKTSDNIESEGEPSDGGPETKPPNAAQKKSAFYSSKYLVVDPKNEAPNHKNHPENEPTTTKHDKTSQN